MPKRTRKHWTLQAAGKLNPVGILEGFVTGHDFSRAANAANETGLQPLRDALFNLSLPVIRSPKTAKRSIRPTPTPPGPKNPPLPPNGLISAPAIWHEARALLAQSAFIRTNAPRSAQPLTRRVHFPVSTNRDTERAIAAAVILISSGGPLDPRSCSSKICSQ